MNLRPRRSDDEPEINLVPLIDVFVFLVVFFMLSSTFMDEGRMRIRLPRASSPPAETRREEPLVVTVTQSGSYRVNERELVNASPETLRAALLKEAGNGRTRPVTIRADARATHQSVVTAMDVLARLGFSRIDIATVEARPTGPAP
ncbi:MAG: biopolymer transporter ExbD [Gammaproteobacteria bacterium]|nr:biopolymer transporter ExbD [Gammaproteobacteria bacterium]